MMTLGMWGILLMACGGDCPTGFRYADLDGDGFGDRDSPSDACDDGVFDTRDCDDGNDAIHPLAEERCNGVDDDCDGLVDNSDDTVVRYLDADRDGHGASRRWEGCSVPPPLYTATVDDDCDDLDPSVSPDAPERCNGLDDNCNGRIDDSNPIDASPKYFDADGDGWGAAYAGDLCPRADLSSLTGDCNDSSSAVSPGANERCDGIDNNCNGLVDDRPTDSVQGYLDIDEDGFGGEPILACQLDTELFVAGLGNILVIGRPGDCDDEEPDVNPFEVEACNGVDDNCNGLVDDEDPTLDWATFTIWYADLDRDGWGDEGDAVESCAAPGLRFVDRRGDCDDQRDLVNPDAIEQCNTIDDDCDGRIDGQDPDLQGGPCP